MSLQGFLLVENSFLEHTIIKTVTKNSNNNNCHLRDHIHPHSIPSLWMEADVEIPPSQTDQKFLQPSKSANINRQQHQHGDATETDPSASDFSFFTCLCCQRHLWWPGNHPKTPAKPWPQQPGRRRATSPRVLESCCHQGYDCWLRLQAANASRQGYALKSWISDFFFKNQSLDW